MYPSDRVVLAVIYTAELMESKFCSRNVVALKSLDTACVSDGIVRDMPLKIVMSNVVIF